VRCTKGFQCRGFHYRECRGFTTIRNIELAVKGNYFEKGKLLVKRRRKDVRMNTEVRDLQEPKKDRSSP